MSAYPHVPTGKPSIISKTQTNKDSDMRLMGGSLSFKVVSEAPIIILKKLYHLSWKKSHTVFATYRRFLCMKLQLLYEVKKALRKSYKMVAVPSFYLFFFRFYSLFPKFCSFSFHWNSFHIFVKMFSICLEKKATLRCKVDLCSKIDHVHSKSDA